MKKEIKVENFEKFEIEKKENKIYVEVVLPLADEVKDIYISYDSSAIKLILQQHGYKIKKVVKPATVTNVSDLRRFGNLVFEEFIFEKKIEKELPENKIEEEKKETKRKIRIKKYGE